MKRQKPSFLFSQCLMSLLLFTHHKISSMTERLTGQNEIPQGACTLWELPIASILVKVARTHDKNFHPTDANHSRATSRITQVSEME